VEDIIGEVEEELGELFPPRPGGLVDRHRKRKAAEAAARENGTDTATMETGRNKVKAVRVSVEAANLAGSGCVVLGPGNLWQQLLPRDQNRRSAVILAVDNDVYVTADQGMALNVAGSASGTGAFYLPAGIAIPVDSQAQLYVACTTTATNSRVSVLISRDSA
jgi:hypothetical protein